jgi:uncharacterized membrane protein
MTSLRARGLGFLVAWATAALMIWDVGRPALWLDESASVAATQRTWPNLVLLLHGSDAPLVPYYALLKVITSAVTSVTGELGPGASLSPEVLFRLPSIVAMTLAAGALTVWLARRAPARLVLSTTTAFLATVGISRYGQEARPYALALLMAVVCTIAWARMVSDRSRRWILLYALTVLLLVAAHLLAGTLVVAHLVAAIIAVAPRSPEPTRRGALLRTAVGAGLGLAVAAPFALPAARKGVGPTRGSAVTSEHLRATFIQVFTNAPHPLLGMGLILVLAAIGLSQVFGPDYRFVARLAAAWAIVPTLTLIPVVLLRPNLLIPRYLVFVVPGWALLCGLGVVTVVDLARRIRPESAAFTAIVTVGLAGPILTALVLSQIGPLNGVRTPGGHSEDIRPALAAADRSPYAGLPIYLSSGYSSLEFAPYDRADEARLVGQWMQRDQASIWPVVDPAASQLWVGHPRLILLLRAPSPARCRERRQLVDGSTLDYVTHCMPKPLKAMGYRVESAEEGGYRWTFAVLTWQPRKH